MLTTYTQIYFKFKFHFKKNLSITKETTKVVEIFYFVTKPEAKINSIAFSNNQKRLQILSHQEKSLKIDDLK